MDRLCAKPSPWQTRNMWIILRITGIVTILFTGLELDTGSTCALVALVQVLQACVPAALVQVVHLCPCCTCGQTSWHSGYHTITMFGLFGSGSPSPLQLDSGDSSISGPSSLVLFSFFHFIRRFCKERVDSDGSAVIWWTGTWGWQWLNWWSWLQGRPGLEITWTESVLLSNCCTPLPCLWFQEQPLHVLVHRL